MGEVEKIADALNSMTNRDLELFVWSLDRRTREWLADNMGQQVKDLKREVEERESEIVGLEEEVFDLREEVARLEQKIDELELAPA